MGAYYYVACHTCKVSSMLPKCPKNTAREVFGEWTEREHNGHETEWDSEYNDVLMERIIGNEIVSYDYYYGYSTRRVGERYKEIKLDHYWER